MRLTPLALAIALAYAIAGEPQFSDRHCLIELRHGAEHLGDQCCRRCILNEGARAICGNDLNALRLLLHDEVARKAVGGLNDDRAHAVAAVSL